MALLYVSLPLAALLAVGHAHSINISAPVPWTKCEHDRSRVMPIIGPYVPQCDANGNFLPQQCWGSTGYCWCVNVLTGEEIPGTRTPPGTLPVDCYGGSPESNMHGDYCPDGWMRHGMRCMIFINTSKTWIEAEFYCMFEGATLVSIHSREENRFVQELTRGDGHTFPPTWIGAHDSIQVGIWLWADGSSFDFFLRIDIHANSSCLGMNSGVQMVWKPYPCEKQLPFVCAKNI